MAGTVNYYSEVNNYLPETYTFDEVAVDLDADMMCFKQLVSPLPKTYGEILLNEELQCQNVEDSHVVESTLSEGLPKSIWHEVPLYWVYGTMQDSNIRHIMGCLSTIVAQFTHQECTSFNKETGMQRG